MSEYTAKELTAQIAAVEARLSSRRDENDNPMTTTDILDLRRQRQALLEVRANFMKKYGVKR